MEKRSKYYEHEDLGKPEKGSKLISGYFDAIHKKTIDHDFIRLPDAEKLKVRQEFVENLVSKIQKDLSNDDPKVKEAATENLKEVLDKLFVEYEG